MKPARMMKPGMMDVFNPRFVNRFFNDFMAGQDDEFFPQMAEFKPGAEIVKTDTGFSVSVALPGVKREDIKIDLDSNVLSISGERKSEHSENKNNVLRSEITYGKFTRSFSLTTDIDKDKIEADFENGILKIKLPVSDKALPKTIEIR